jgi:hypothetical protein
MTQPNEDLIQILEHTLALAREGQITNAVVLPLGPIVDGPTVFYTLLDEYSAPHLSMLLCQCSMVQDTIMHILQRQRARRLEITALEALSKEHAEAGTMMPAGLEGTLAALRHHGIKPLP